MDIVTRLKMFMEQAGISSSQFADTCEIPRPTLSQLLNGRNKKVSDEVIGKIHRAYPSLNVMWLMFGDGEMLLKGGDIAQAGDAVAVPSARDSHVEDPVQRAISFDDEEPSGYSRAMKQSPRVASATSMSETIQSIMRSTSAGRGQQRGASAGDRRVVKMLVFYSDGRFEEFSPTHPS
jgi:transcriptional regulator with XRE-family HTH domain